MEEIYNKLLDEIIDNRVYKLMLADAEDARILEQVKVIAKRHNIPFIECFNILVELAALTQYEE